MSKIVLKAIHDTDLENILKRLKVYENVLNGVYRCVVCNRKITLENLGGIYMENGELRFVCNDIKCLAKVAEKLSRK